MPGPANAGGPGRKSRGSSRPVGGGKMKANSWAMLLATLLGVLAARADDPFERPPISYSTATPKDAIALLRAKLSSGEVRLDGDEKQIVRKLLSSLGIPETSQMLVFSKTSFQKDRINPAHTRAVYFSA